MKTIPQLNSTDDIQLFIDYMDSEEDICQEAVDYFKLFVGNTMEETAIKMREEQHPKIKKWFGFGLIFLFPILPIKVREQYFSEIINTNETTLVTSKLIKIMTNYKPIMSKTEKEKYHNFIKSQKHLLPKMFKKYEKDL